MNKKFDVNLLKKNGLDCVTKIAESLNQLPVLKLKKLDKDNTAIVVIDMIDGFAKKGNLYSDRVESLIPYIVKIMEKFKNFEKLFFADTHSAHSEEFKTYPEHGTPETGESKLIQELQKFLGDKGLLLKKNSTNGFMAKDFAEWLSKHQNVTQYVVLGDLSDVCVMQFVLSLKAYFNEWDIPSRIIIPVRGVETFDLEATNHNGDLMNLFALYNMQMNGTELVSDIN